MSKLIYNGVRIGYLSTKAIEYTDMMSEDGQDYVGTEIKITVAGLVDFSDALRNDVFPQNPADVAWSGLQHALEHPRMALEAQIGRIYIFADATSDIKNGPFPKVLSITQADGIAVLHVTFQVTTYKYNCPLGAGYKTKPILISNRWQEDESRNEQGLAIRTRRGKLIILGGLMPMAGGPGYVSAGLFRFACLPVLPPGAWVREKVIFALASDGLSMTYTVEDREVTIAPPVGSPSVRCNMVFTEASNATGSRRWGTVVIDMKGGKSGNMQPGAPFFEVPFQMISVAIAMGFARLKLARFLTVAGAISGAALPVMQLTIKHNVMECSIEITLKCELSPFYRLGHAFAPDGILNPQTATNSGYTTSWPFLIPFTPDIYSSTDGYQPFFPFISFDSAGNPVDVVNAPPADNLTCMPPTPNPPPPPNSSVLGTADADADADATQVLMGQAATLSSQNGAGEDSTLQQIKNFQTGMVGQLPEFMVNAETNTGAVPDAPYTAYDVRPNFIEDTHVIELPTCSSDGDVAFPQVATKTKQLVLEWYAERLNQPPAYPPAVLTGPSCPVLLRKEIMPGMMERLPTGMYKYTIAGSYIFGFRKPDKVVESAAIPPWAQDAENAMIAQMGQSTTQSIVGQFLQQAAENALCNPDCSIFSIHPPATSQLVTPPGA